LNLLAGVAVLWIEMRNGEIEGRSIVRGVFAGSTCRRNCVDAVAIADKTLQAFEVTRNAMMLPQAVAYSLNHSDSTASYRVHASTQIEVEGSPMYHHVKKLMYTVNIEEPDVRFGTCYWSNSVARMGRLPLQGNTRSKDGTVLTISEGETC
jgi:hypothetical protein